MAETTRAVFKITISGTTEQVWREITRTDGPNQAFFNMKMDVDEFKVGGKLRMGTLSGKYTGVVGEITEWDPPRRFAHTFKFTNYDDPECRMIYELKEVGGQVEFTLIAEDIPVGTKTAKQLSSGGNMIIKTLKAVVERGRPPLGTRILYRLFGLLEPMSPKRCRSENWQ